MLDAWEGVAPDAWAARWRVPRVEAHARIGSTNDRARLLAEAGAEPFTTVIAEEQTEGRGREGRRWDSPAASGLWMSVVAPPLPVGERSPLPLRAGLAVCRAAERAAPGVRAALKWPNDVLVGGRKLSGILCEGVGAVVVIGIGVNVRAGAFSPELVGQAIALDEAAGRAADRATLAEAVLDELRNLLAPGSLALDGEIARELDARDALRGLEVVPDAGAPGIARGIDPDGALRVEVASGDVRRLVGGGVRARVTSGT